MVLALRAQLTVLELGNRVIIQDVLLPEPGMGPRWKEKSARFVILFLLFLILFGVGG